MKGQGLRCPNRLKKFISPHTDFQNVINSFNVYYPLLHNAFLSPEAQELFEQHEVKHILKTIMIPLTLPLSFIIHSPQACTHVDYLCFIDVEANCTAGSP